MDIQAIINELSMNRLINVNSLKYEKLSGGTTSHLYLLTDYDNDLNYVVKLNEPQVLKSEASFLEFYKNENLLPHLLYVEQSFKYIVYSFISGSTSYSRKNKKEILTTLTKQLINNYQSVQNATGWGWADELTDSWQRFLLNRLDEANTILESYVTKDAVNFLFELAKSPNRKSSLKDPFLLHGDCGVHNFIFKKDNLCGVIDPTPVLGEPLYDLIYAFCSSPDDLSKETFNSAVSHFQLFNDKSEQALYEEVLIGLGLRIATCVRHHPEDLEEYLKAWNYWMNIAKGKFI